MRYSTASESAADQTFGGYYFELTYHGLTVVGPHVTCTKPLTRCEGPAGTIVELARTGEILTGRRILIDFQKREVRIEDLRTITRRF